MREREIKIQPFEKDMHYTFESDPNVADKTILFAHLKPAGQELIIQYYKKKYHTNIIRPKKTEAKKTVYFTEEEFLSNVTPHIQEFKDKKNVRCTFLLDSDDHVLPIIYIKENEDQALIYANTLASYTRNILSALQDLQKETGIHVFVVKKGRQLDSHSCSVDALVFSRIATAKDKKTDEYLLPDLLDFLKANSTEKEDHYKAVLSDHFLITSQRLPFVTDHREAAKEKQSLTFWKEVIVNKEKEETLDKHRARYSGSVKFEHKTEIESSSYLRKKGHKYANLIEIQFYINQLSIIYQDQWTPDVEKKFIIQAKNELNNQGHTKDRVGLFNFTQDFLSYLEKNNQKTTTLLLSDLFRKILSQSDSVLASQDTDKRERTSRVMTN